VSGGDWLETRTPPIPDGLRERLRAALNAPADEPALAAADVRCPATLADAGIARLEAAIAQGSDRAAAYDLLAADALLTYAFEAAAEAGPEAVAALLAETGPERFSTDTDTTGKAERHGN
jgi:hypothetical protein